MACVCTGFLIFVIYIYIYIYIYIIYYQSCYVDHDTNKSAVAQLNVITEALRNAKICGNEINYVETNGGATILGDASEINALKAALYVDRQIAYPLVLGSLKTNIGAYIWK